MSRPDPRIEAARRKLNDLLAVRAYESGQGRLVHRPVELYFQIASACNLDCYMCSEHNRPKEWRRGRGATSMPPALFEKAERELFPYAKRLTIGVGGEPMISPRFLEYVARARNAGLRVHVMTNGTRIVDDQVAEAMVRNIHSLEISIDAATRETYERIRLGGSWNGIRANVARIHRARRGCAGAVLEHLTLCFVLMKSNVAEFADFVTFAHEIGADRVAGWAVIPVTEAGRVEALCDDHERINACLDRARARGVELGIEVDVPRDLEPSVADDMLVGLSKPLPTGHEPASVPPLGAGESAFVDFEVLDHVLPGGETQEEELEPEPLGEGMLREAARQRLSGGPVHCSSPTNSVFVFYDGRVLPCCHPHAIGSMNLGNLALQSFDEIWNGPLYRNLRMGLNQGDAPPLCRACSIVHSPPPRVEEAQELVGPGRSLADHYRGRELQPQQQELFVVDALAATFDDLSKRDEEASEDRKQLNLVLQEREAQLDHERERLADFESHVANLERVIDKTRARTTYRTLGWLKSLLIQKAPSSTGEQKEPKE